MPEFFSRMQHHYPTRCSRVESTPPSTPFQTALNAAIARPSALERACGDSGCLDALMREWQSATGQKSTDALWRYAALGLVWLVLFNILLWLARRILERVPLDCRLRKKGAKRLPLACAVDAMPSSSNPLLALRTRKPPPPPLAQMGRGMDI